MRHPTLLQKHDAFARRGMSPGILLDYSPRFMNAALTNSTIISRMSFASPALADACATPLT